MYAGIIKGIGARYCPSIEDKVMRFPEKDRHQIFLEPEGLDTVEVYPNGLPTSLPLATQTAMIHSIKGLEKAQIIRPGYAIEYDYIDPLGLHPSLETKQIRGSVSRRTDQRHLGLRRGRCSGSYRRYQCSPLLSGTRSP